MRRNSLGAAAVVAAVGLLVCFCQGCDRPPVSGRVETATGYIEYQKVNGAWLLVEYDRQYDVTVSETVQTAAGPAFYVKKGWWGSWERDAAPAAPAPGAPLDAGGGLTNPGDSEPYHGLSEQEKQAIWRNELPMWSFEDREKARKGE